jgi:hypothetical protein
MHLLWRFKNLPATHVSLVPIRAMTGLGANSEIRPKNSFQKVSIFDTSYLSQKWCSYCKEAKHIYL